ncbi:MAG TPA: PKD domain-containing protein [Candidatus Woesearchaeota archaeon]|jgi:hypothetical protein|nr:PKD domain-containing protein [Candidatus Woesearchaeota archaeon]
MIKKEIIFVLMIISVFLISACDVYNNPLHVTEGEAVEIPEEDIIVEAEEETDMDEEAVSEAPDEETEEETDMDEEAVSEAPDEETEEETEVVMEEEISEDATVIMVDETQMVSLVPQAQDPDQDALIFTFTSPLNENGEWQTTYGDAGEYTVTVTVSDGTLSTSQQVLVIINKKEEAPVFDSFSPEEQAIEIDETGSVAFDVQASDLNDDELRHSWKLDGIDSGNENSYQFQTTYEDSGSHTVKVTVSDDVFETEKIWAVTVNNVNRKPVLEGIDDIEADETDIIIIRLDANDADGDELSYAMDDERFVQDGNLFTWETTYDDSGEHSVTATVSDGQDTTSQEISVAIENVNRAPIILDIVQK